MAFERVHPAASLNGIEHQPSKLRGAGSSPAALYGPLTRSCHHGPKSRWCSPRRAAQQAPRMRFDAAASGGLFLLHRTASSVGALLWIGAMLSAAAVGTPITRTATRL